MNKEEISKRIDEGLKILKQEPSFIFNLEEINAIDYLQFCYDISTIDKESLPKLGIALNLIDKLQKVINLMAEDIYDNDNFWKLKCAFEKVEKGKEKDYIKERFFKKVEEENE